MLQRQDYVDRRERIAREFYLDMLRESRKSRKRLMQMYGIRSKQRIHQILGDFVKKNDADYIWNILKDLIDKDISSAARNEEPDTKDPEDL